MSRAWPKVSVGTVSKALNNNGSLRQETRERVIAVARELGFRPNDLAQSLHRGQTFTVGLISNDCFGRFTIPIMEGLEECLTDSRIAVFMCNATDDPGARARSTSSAARASGSTASSSPPAAPTGARGSACRAPGLPVLYVFSQSDDPDALCLLPDDEGGARARRRPSRRPRPAAASPTSPGPSASRRCGCAATATARRSQRRGLAEPEGFYLPGVWSEGWGREAVAQLFRGRVPPPDAIFCGNDQIARGVCDALRERGIVVPDAVSRRRLRQLGDHRRGDAAAAHQRRHEPRRRSAARPAATSSG